MSTLYEQLQPFAESLDEDDYSVTFGAFEQVTRVRMRTTALYRPLITALIVLPAPCLGTPLCDLGLSRVSPDLRKNIVVLTSLVAECPVCSAQHCRMGKFGGPTKNPLRLTGGDGMKIGERLTLNAVVNATKLPACRGERARENIVKNYGEKGLQAIALICGFEAFTNTYSELLCVAIDEDVAVQGKTELAQTGWTISPKRVMNLKIGLSKNNHPRYVNLMRFASSISRHFGDFPSKRVLIHDWLKSNFGFLPRYFKELHLFPAKRAICFSLNMALFSTKDVHISFKDKLILSVVSYLVIPNNYLASHFAYVAEKNGVETSEILEAFGSAKTMNVADPPTDFRSLALFLTVKIARRDPDHYALTPRLLEASENNHLKTLELTYLLAILAMLQRYSAMYDDGSGLESELRDFASSKYLHQLGLSTVDHVANTNVSNSTMVTNAASTIKATIWGGGKQF
ncbi:hypothetical protein BC830DRAFT_1139115 [Chytriomyces sp. MP71]|nr:hypothetical protein BC830DRAFT_1139115 [Chytriomyces sp. MP71]